MPEMRMTGFTVTGLRCSPYSNLQEVGNAIPSRKSAENSSVRRVAKKDKTLSNTLRNTLRHFATTSGSSGLWSERHKAVMKRQSIFECGVSFQCFATKNVREDQKCLQWGRANLVYHAEWPKIGLLNRGPGFWEQFVDFPRKIAKHGDY